MADADEKISAMTAAAALDGTEVAPLVQAGGNVKAALTAIGAAILNTFGQGGVSFMADGEAIFLAAQDGSAGDGGQVDILAGNGNGGNGGRVRLFSGYSITGGDGGNIVLTAADAQGAGDHNGGNVIIVLGQPSNAGAHGQLEITNAISTPGAAAGTLTNAPAAGNPQTWLAVTINGVAHFIPAWHV